MKCFVGTGVEHICVPTPLRGGGLCPAPGRRLHYVRVHLSRSSTQEGNHYVDVCWSPPHGLLLRKVFMM